MKKIKFILLILICLGITSDLFGQDENKWVVERENRYEKYSKFNGYVDTYPDTLFHKGEVYFFRRTPLSLKKGYTNVFYELPILVEAFGMAIRGIKGYTLTWIIKNDSLFIKNIYPNYPVSDMKRITNEDGSVVIQKIFKNVMPCDSVKSRVEHFAGNKFKENLLHVDWISGDFGIIESYDENGHHHDGQNKKGFLLTFQNGKLKKIKKDKREIKN
jgi:hypothetical protein